MQGFYKTAGCKDHLVKTTEFQCPPPAEHSQWETTSENSWVLGSLQIGIRVWRATKVLADSKPVSLRTPTHPAPLSKLGVYIATHPQPRKAAPWPSLHLPIMITLAPKLTESTGETAAWVRWSGVKDAGIPAHRVPPGKCTGEGEGGGGSQWPCSSALSSRAVLSFVCSPSVLAAVPLACFHDTKGQTEHGRHAQPG